MIIPIRLPSLGDGVESATISQWLVTPGGSLTQGERIVEVSTDKVDTEIESPVSGVLVEIRIGQDDIAEVGAVIATVDDGTDAALPSGERSVAPFEVVAQAEVAQNPPASVETAAPPAGESTETGAADGLRGTTQKLSRLRKVIASRMVESLQVSAQLTTIVEVDVTEVGRIRRRHNGDLDPTAGVKLSYLPFIAVATLDALRTFPQVNSQVDVEAGTISYPAAEHLGVAVDTDRGLFVPVIRDAGLLSVTALAARIVDVAERTRANRIVVDELSGGTFTITNTGSRGALMDTPIINQPQVAILGAGVVTRRPVIQGREGEDESIAVRSMVYLSLTYDHRVVDGADAARFLSMVKETLERGSFDLGARPPG